MQDIRFLFVGSTASSPPAITDSSLRFATLGGNYPWQDFHLQELCHARHTEKRRSEDFASLNAFISGRNRYSITLLVDESITLGKPADCLAAIRRFHFLIREDTTRPTSLNGIQMPLLLILWNTLCSSFLLSRFVIGWPVSAVNLS
jgi:hypothetical protein